MDRTEIAVLKPVEELYKDRIEAGILLFLRNIVALTAPLNDLREPVGPVLYRGPHPRRNIRGRRYILVLDTQADFDTCIPLRASDDREAIEIANERLSDA